MVLGGEFLEPSKREVLEAVLDQDDMQMVTFGTKSVDIDPWSESPAG